MSLWLPEDETWLEVHGELPVKKAVRKTEIVRDKIGDRPVMFSEMIRSENKVTVVETDDVVQKFW